MTAIFDIPRKHCKMHAYMLSGDGGLPVHGLRDFSVVDGFVSGETVFIPSGPNNNVMLLINVLGKKMFLKLQNRKSDMNKN